MEGERVSCEAGFTFFGHESNVAGIARILTIYRPSLWSVTITFRKISS